MIVLDASALFEVLLNTSRGRQIAQRIVADGDVHAPHLIDIEVSHAVRRYVQMRQLSEAQGQQAIENLVGFALTRYPHTRFLTRIWDLRSNLTPYDAAYVTLAEALDAPLLTCDAKIAASRVHQAHIELM